VKSVPGENIVLIGFMGSGKSSVGRLIASKLGYRFVDTDHLVVDAAGSRISEIFAAKGEAHFRELETRALESLLGRERLVVATGGGIVTRKKNVAMLKTLGFVAWLKADEEVIFERVSRSKKRPLVQTADPRETIAKLLAERTPLYAGAARFATDTSARTHAQIADEVIAEARRFFAEKTRQG
jgi:shikimate kinase